MALESVQEIMNASVSASGVGILARSEDASLLRVSALGVNIADVSNSDAGDFLVSAKSGDAAQLRVSANAATAFTATDAASPNAAQLNAFGSTGYAATIPFGFNGATYDRLRSVSGAGAGLGSLQTAQATSYYYLSATGIFTVKANAGILHSIVINKKGTTSTLKLYDHASTTSNLFATIDTATSLNTLLYDAKFSNGLTVSSADAGAADLTINYI